MYSTVQELPRVRGGSYTGTISRDALRINKILLEIAKIGWKEIVLW